MSSQGNYLENLINSFKMACSALEKKAEFNLKQSEKECEEDFWSSVESLHKFNTIILGISETCAEVVNNDILKRATKSNVKDNVINLPYEMHADVVKCINELYNIPSLGKNSVCGKFFNERNKELVIDLVKICKKNIHDVEDIENTIIEAKEIF